MYWRFVKHNYVLSLNYYHGIYIVFFTVNSSVNAARSSLNAVCWRKLHRKGIQLKTFPQGNIISPCGVVINKVFRLIVVMYRSIKPKVQRSSPTHYLIFFSFFALFCLLICVVVFYKYLPK